MSYHEIPNDSEFLRNLNPTSDLELIEIDFYKVTVDQHEGQVICLFSSPDKILGVELNSIEGTMLTFTASDCSENSHLRTIYHLYTETMQLCKFTLEKVIIESKRGDMLYGRLHWVDEKKRKILKVCSAGDAIVLAIMSNVKIYMVKSVYDEMDDYSEYDQKLTDEYE